MRLLCIMHCLPRPEMTGDLRHYHLLTGLAPRHTVRLLVAAQRTTWHADDRKRLEAALDGVKITPIAFPEKALLPKLANRVLRQFSSRIAPYWLDSSFAQEIRQEIATFQPHVIHAYMHCADYCSWIRDVPVVVDLCDAWNLQASGWGNYLQTWRRRLATRRYEAFVASFAETVTVVANRDADALNCPHEKIGVVPIGADLKYYTPCAEPYDEHTVSFVGGMDYPPNVDGVLYFASEIWPVVRKAIPDAKAYVVGRDPVRAVYELHGRNGITVTGTVDDVRPYVWKSALTISPLRFASGQQFKVIQSLAMGVPVVLTPAANGGIGAREENGAIVASDAATLAESTVELMQHRNRRNLLGSLGRRYVEENFTWERAIRKFENVHLRAIESHRATRRQIPDACS